MIYDEIVLGLGTVGSYYCSINTNISRLIIDVGETNLSDTFANDKEKQTDVLTRGRRFGLGGTSKIWGGQIVFDENYLKEQHDITEVEINAVKNRLGIPLSKDKAPHVIGYWLHYWRRNLYNKFKKKLNGQSILNGIVLSFEEKDGLVYVEVWHDNSTSIFISKNLIVCLGAFETSRLLYQSNVICNDIGFDDHISVSLKKNNLFEDFKLNDAPMKLRLGGIKTYRYVPVGQVGMFHHVYKNLGINIIKELLFTKQKTLTELRINEIYSFIKSILAIVFFLRVKSSEYSFSYDFATFDKVWGEVCFSKEKDKFGRYHIIVRRKELPLHFRNNEVLKEIPFVCIENPEIYHPSNLFAELLNQDLSLSNMPMIKILSTGSLKNSTSVNPTAAVFAIIEKFLNSEK